MASNRKSRPFNTIPVNPKSVAAPTPAVKSEPAPSPEAEGSAFTGYSDAPLSSEPALEPVESASAETAGVATSITQPSSETPIPASPEPTSVQLAEFQELQLLMIKAWRESLESQLAFTGALIQTSSVSEAVALHGAFFRSRYEAFASQWREWSSLALRAGGRGV